MTTFAEIQFPPDISQGATGGPKFSTSIIVLSSGAEQRNRNWTTARGEWDVSKALQTQAQVEALIDFFTARAGRAVAFRFKDWTDYQLPRWINTPGDLVALPTLFTTDGHTATFQLIKVYGDIIATYSRVITKPVAGTLVLYNNGVVTYDFTVNTATGVVTLGGTTTATTGHVITGHCEFDTPVRFDVDELKITIDTLDILKWNAIPVVEVRDV
jgi:uncharacterized protein (TIGR02217 family)